MNSKKNFFFLFYNISFEILQGPTKDTTKCGLLFLNECILKKKSFEKKKYLNKNRQTKINYLINIYR